LRRKRPHKITIRIYYEDTDFSGLWYITPLTFASWNGDEVNYRGALACIEESFLKAQRDAFFFVVRAMDIDFRKPALMDVLRQPSKHGWKKSAGPQ